MIAETLISSKVGAIALNLLSPVANYAKGKINDFVAEKWDLLTTSLDAYLASTTHKHQYFNSQVFSNDGQLLEHYYIPLNLGIM